jgi:hypothetical protein
LSSQAQTLNKININIFKKKFEPHMSSILHQFAFAAGIVAIRLHWLKIVKRSVAVALAGITQKLKTH